MLISVLDKSLIEISTYIVPLRNFNIILNFCSQWLILSININENKSLGGYCYYIYMYNNIYIYIFIFKFFLKQLTGHRTI